MPLAGLLINPFPISKPALLQEIVSNDFSPQDSGWRGKGIKACHGKIGTSGRGTVPVDPLPQQTFIKPRKVRTPQALHLSNSAGGWWYTYPSEKYESVGMKWHSQLFLESLIKFHGSKPPSRKWCSISGSSDTSSTAGWVYEQPQVILSSQAARNPGRMKSYGIYHDHQSTVSLFGKGIRSSGDSRSPGLCGLCHYPPLEKWQQECGLEVGGWNVARPV